MIIEGNSAVWVQVDSGNQAADDEAFERLQSRLKFFEAVAELPEIDPNDPSSRLGPGPKLELKFSAFRIKRENPVAKMIAGDKLDSLPEAEPWIAPIFGRGRVLGIWEASRMDEEGIDEACFYLTGACSCQVKVQNPGWDLVMNVDWDERLLAVFQEEGGETETVVEEDPDPGDFEVIFAPPAMEINFLPIIGLGIFAVGVFLIVRNRRKVKK
ncbi:MAG: hypothetical protein P1V20_18505 [Verrucomicrobiales bacterium]|nr:hypothetical protein [Verrucomicrobiales bacterium]